MKLSFYPRSDALPRSTPLLFVIALLASVVPPLVTAQGFFQNFFGGGGQGGGQEAPPLGNAAWFHDRVEAATCAKYLCPKTLSCVNRPEECPCPFQQQIACPYPDFERDDDGASSSRRKPAGVVCVTATECNRVQRLLRVGSGFKLKDLKA
ncbi:hypothetical protein V8E36_006057 [Tilletia maclaganii]